MHLFGISPDFQHEASRLQAAYDMTGHWIGPKPIKEFLDEYLPPALVHAGLAPVIPEFFPTSMDADAKSETDVCNILVRKIQEHEIIPGFKIIDTPSHRDSDPENNSKIKPGLSLYEESVQNGTKAMQFGCLEMPIEVKPKGFYDPFCDPKEDITAEERKTHVFESTTDAGTNARGQLVLYGTEMLRRQHRWFAFSIFIAYPYVRFIRWDRSAGVVSKSFDIRQDSHFFVDFLWRYVHLSRESRGFDDTVRPANGEEEKLAETHLAKWKPSDARPVIVFRITDDGIDREFVAWGPISESKSLIGRATKAYPVYEKATGNTFFLKDSWRAATAEQESSILRLLNQHDVQNVPKLVCGGDVPGHRTMSHLCGVEEDHPLFEPDSGLRQPEWKCGTDFIQERVHHRFVEDFIGTHLHKIQSSKQLMQAVYDAFVAHQEAVEKCGILHRDVSGKNVMMTEDGRGVLNDWDLAKKIVAPPEIERPRMLHRTGTWQFISATLLLNPGKQHMVQDDMESFIYVVLYFALRFIDHTAKGSVRIRSTMDQVFDENHPDDHGLSTGGNNKINFFYRPQNYLGNAFAFKSQPLQSWFRFILKAVKQWHTYEDERWTLPPAAEESEDALENILEDHLIPEQLLFADHTKLRKQWEVVLGLSTWPENDVVPDNAPSNAPRITPDPALFAALTSKYSQPTNSTSSVLSKRSFREDSDGEDRLVKKSRSSGTAA